MSRSATPIGFRFSHNNGRRDRIEVSLEHHLVSITNPLCGRLRAAVQVRVYELARPVAILGHLIPGW